MKNKCKECNKRTRYMYRLNAGVFCEKHWEIALARQKGNESLQALREHLNLNTWK